MSLAFYIVPQRQPRAFDTGMDGKALAHAEEALAEICARLGVKRPMDFVSMDPGEIGDIVGEDVPNAPPEQWFAAAEGLAMVRALRTHLAKDGATIESADRVQADLAECERILAYLAQKRIAWHFAIDL
jgi:hypothetical protein